MRRYTRRFTDFHFFGHSLVVLSSVVRTRGCFLRDDRSPAIYHARARCVCEIANGQTERAPVISESENTEVTSYQFLTLGNARWSHLDVY